MSEIIVTDDGNEKQSKPLIIFGKDIREIKCFRSSFIFGICGGVAGGLLCFMATSKPMFSTHVGVASVWLCVFGYWFPCRYQYESQVLKVHHWKTGVKNKKKDSEEDILEVPVR